MKDIHKFMNERDIIMSYRGDLTHKMVTSLLGFVKKILQSSDTNYHSRKRLYAILAECTDNITKNSAALEKTLLPTKYTSSIFSISEHEEHFKIQTGNYILNEQIPILKQKLEKVNSMDAEELKEFYKKSLLRKQDGGLGIIDISIRSAYKLSYEFIYHSNKVSFFCLQTILNKY
ncbi:MAG: hypothetical protein H0W84_10860 [Bacteroidetes bacterium]|nr:hypothetical protein [Bacteroidota bacterium]